MSITSIKLDGGISDPEFVEISANARKHERAPAGLAAYLCRPAEKGKPTPEEIYSSIERWIARELPIRRTNNEPLMIDIETLSNPPNAVICAIGAVFFEPSTGKIGPSFYQTIDPRNAESRRGYLRRHGDVVA
jgi:hypothetical protein